MFTHFDDILFEPPTNDLEHRRLPVEPASVEGYIKHVNCDGSRDHVPSYSYYEDWRGGFSITWCSHHNCIMNHVANEQLRAHGKGHLCRE